MLCFGWIDNNNILTLSTIYTIDQANDIVFFLYKHPVETSKNAVNAPKLFDNKAHMLLGISKVINNNNNSYSIPSWVANLGVLPVQRRKTALQSWKKPILTCCFFYLVAVDTTSRSHSRI